MKILYVATISGTMRFFAEHIKMLLEEGHNVEIACNTNGKIPEYCTDMKLKIHHIPFSRSPFSMSNIIAFKKLRELVKNEKYDVVHTHTPNASACVRLACRKLRKEGLKVFYTAHGFHFYNGAPLKNWLIYYPIEWLCSYFTDTLITINYEDYKRAKKHMHSNNIEYVPGVGINLSKFDNLNVKKSEKRKELGIPEDAFLMLSVGELNENKNHQTVIKAIDGMDVYYIIAGLGPKCNELQNLISQQNMTDKIKLLGYRNDVLELYAASDIFIFPSYREGLSVSVMEAMASGLPCVVSKIRGNTDLIDENGGILFNPYDVNELALVLKNINVADMGDYNKNKIKTFDIKNVLQRMKEIYNI